MDLLTQEELDEIINKLDLKGFKEEIKERKSKAGRKPKDIYNHYFFPLSGIRYGTEESDLNPWVDDVLRGAGMLNEGESHTTVSSYMIFALLKGLPFLSTAEIKNWLNRKRSALGGDVITSDRYCRDLLVKCHSAIKSLDYHVDNGKKLIKETENNWLFNYSDDASKWNQQKDKCILIGLPVTTNLDNPLNGVPLNDRKLLAGLTVDEINNPLCVYISTAEIELDLSLFNKSDEIGKIHPGYSKEEFEKVRKHPDSYLYVPIKKLPQEMVDLDTGEIITYYSTAEIHLGINL